jgi:hypothetical protein
MPTPNAQAQTAMLSTPTPPPTPTGQLGASANTYNPWQTFATPPPTNPQSGADSAYLAGAASMGSENPGLTGVSANDLNRVASNVGGIVKDSPGGAEQWKTYTPESKDMVEEETNEFLDAFNKGHVKETEGDIWSGGWSGEGNIKEAGTMGAARQAKRDDRKQDREARQQQRQEQWELLKEQYMEEGMSEAKANRKARRESRRTKRAVRQGQTDARKASWEAFKGERELQSQDDAMKLQNQYE